LNEIQDYEAFAVVIHGERIAELTEEEWDAIFEKEEVFSRKITNRIRLFLHEPVQRTSLKLSSELKRWAILLG